MALRLPIRLGVIALLSIACLASALPTSAQTGGSASCLCTVAGIGFPFTGQSGAEINRSSFVTDDHRATARRTCENAPLSGRFNATEFSCTVPRACEPSFAQTLTAAMDGIRQGVAEARCATAGGTAAPAPSGGTGTTGGTAGGTAPPSSTPSTPGTEEATNSATTGEAAERPFVPIRPNPSVPIPGVEFTDAREQGGMIEIPYLAQYISGIYRLSVGLGAILAAIMIVYGGFRYMLAAALPQVQESKTIIQDAVIGLVVLLSSFLILKTINPKLVEVAPIRVQRIINQPPSEESMADSIARNESLNASPGSSNTNTSSEADEDGPPVTRQANGPGPASYCRQTLQPCNAQGNVWCGACRQQVAWNTHNIGGPDPACRALLGACTGLYGRFLSTITGNCQSRDFRSLEGLDGGTYGILGSMHQNLTRHLQLMRTNDQAAYDRVVAAGNNQDTSPAALCASNQNDRGFICNTNYRNILQAALPTRAFTIAQLEDSYRKFQQRIRSANSHGFRSSYGVIMWATVGNNPGACGSGFERVFAACSQFTGGSESERIDCFLEKYVELGCRGGVGYARSRANTIRQLAQGLSKTDSVAPPSLDQVKACVPQF